MEVENNETPTVVDKQNEVNLICNISKKNNEETHSSGNEKQKDCESINMSTTSSSNESSKELADNLNVNDKTNTDVMGKKSVVETFKKPLFTIDFSKGHTQKLKNAKQGLNAEVFLSPDQQVKHSATLEKAENNSIPPQLVEKYQPVAYKEPSWSGIPKDEYKLEVLKSGVILENVNLSNKPFHVIGRLPICDISLAHPTVSRYHAILQYRHEGDEKNEKGMYIYDLGSTHGTFWNGNRIKPKIYVRVQGGHMLRFGCSQRKFILQAPESDEEEESEFSVTELKQMRQKEMEEKERQRIEEEETERIRKEKEEEAGIDWGMGEDAEEETDLSENPYAQTNNEELFLDDPKKTLRGWFEREGCDLHYNTEDRGFGKFLCWIDLPIESTSGRAVRAEALVSGKKKEAVVQCALEACRILDRMGLLRQAHHESKKRKSKNWEENDFYDSDEDNFLDRTGSVERKRQHRMKVLGKDVKAETYDTLMQKYDELTKKISKLETNIAHQKAIQSNANNSDIDSLDAFMSNINSFTMDKTQNKFMKIELSNLRKEEIQLLKLINVAKPTNLPPLKPFIPTILPPLPEIESIVKAKVETEKTDMVAVEENEALSDTCENSENEDTESEEENNLTTNDNDPKKDCIKRQSFSSEPSSISQAKNDFAGGSCSKNSDINEEMDADENLSERKSSRKRKIHIKKNKNADKDITEDNESYYGEKFCTWVFPENETGDGRTNLNDKYGY